MNKLKFALGKVISFFNALLQAISIPVIAIFSIFYTLFCVLSGRQINISNMPAVAMKYHRAIEFVSVIAWIWFLFSIYHHPIVFKVSVIIVFAITAFLWFNPALMALGKDGVSSANEGIIEALKDYGSTQIKNNPFVENTLAYSAYETAFSKLIEVTDLTILEQVYDYARMDFSLYRNEREKMINPYEDNKMSVAYYAYEHTWQQCEIIKSLYAPDKFTEAELPAIKQAMLDYGNLKQIANPYDEGSIEHTAYNNMWKYLLHLYHKQKQRQIGEIAAEDCVAYSENKNPYNDMQPEYYVYNSAYSYVEHKKKENAIEEAKKKS